MSTNLLINLDNFVRKYEAISEKLQVSLWYILPQPMMTTDIRLWPSVQYYSMPNSHYNYVLLIVSENKLRCRGENGVALRRNENGRVYKFPEGRLRSYYSTRICLRICRPTLSHHRYLQWSMKRLQLAMCCSEVGCRRREHDSQIDDSLTAVMLWISLYRSPVIIYCYVPQVASTLDYCRNAVSRGWL